MLGLNHTCLPYSIAICHVNLALYEEVIQNWTYLCRQFTNFMFYSELYYTFKCQRSLTDFIRRYPQVNSVLLFVAAIIATQLNCHGQTTGQTRALNSFKSSKSYVTIFVTFYFSKLVFNKKNPLNVIYLSSFSCQDITKHHS